MADMKKGYDNLIIINLYEIHSENLQNCIVDLQDGLFIKKSNLSIQQVSRHPRKVNSLETVDTNLEGFCYTEY